MNIKNFDWKSKIWVLTAGSSMGITIDLLWLSERHDGIAWFMGPAFLNMIFVQPVLFLLGVHGTFLIDQFMKGIDLIVAILVIFFWTGIFYGICSKKEWQFYLAIGLLISNLVIMMLLMIKVNSLI